MAQYKCTRSNSFCIVGEKYTIEEIPFNAGYYLLNGTNLIGEKFIKSYFIPIKEHRQNIINKLYEKM